MARHGENIRKRKDGRWEGRYLVYSEAKGRTIYRSVYGSSYEEIRKKLEAEKCQKGPGGSTGPEGSTMLGGSTRPGDSTWSGDSAGIGGSAMPEGSAGLGGGKGFPYGNIPEIGRAHV